MPQLDPTYFASQIFWLVVSFGIFYLLMARIALPRVGQLLQDRRDRVRNDRARAEAIHKEAEEALAAYEASLAKARADAQSITAEAAQEAADESSRRNEALGAKLGKEIADAESRIEEQREKAMTELRKAAREIAQDVVARLTGMEPDTRSVTGAVTAASRTKS